MSHAPIWLGITGMRQGVMFRIQCSSAVPNACILTSVQDARVGTVACVRHCERQQHRAAGSRCQYGQFHVATGWQCIKLLIVAMSNEEQADSMGVAL